MKSTKHSGFSLLEVSIAFVIVAILAGITASVVVRGRDGAKDTVALSNLKQLGIAHTLYAADQDDYLPYWISKKTGWAEIVEEGNKKTIKNKRVTKADDEKWKLLLLPYAGPDSIFYSPADQFARTDQKFQGTSGPLTSRHTSYAYTHRLGDLRVMEDGGVLWTLTGTSNHQFGNNGPLMGANIILDPRNSRQSACVHRLAKTGPALFPDGSVKMVPMKQISLLAED